MNTSPSGNPHEPGVPPRAFLALEALDAWLDRLAHTRHLLAPRQVEGVVYRPVASRTEIAPPALRPVLSIKEVLFPPTERLFTIQKTGVEIQLHETLPEGETIVYGLRPCEAHGMQLLDAVFLSTLPSDPYYARRRASTVFIGLACRELGPSCFCTSVGGGPDRSEGMDLLLTEVEGGAILEICSEQGKTLVADLPLTDFAGDLPKASSGSTFPDPARLPWPAHFKEEFWEKMGERCLSCRACSYVCPTCRCFAVRDERLASGSSERIRCWDACTGENYRRLAGGHRGRPLQGERLRNRFYCKFYYYPEQYGLGQASACVGCGRCIDVCPVGVDITEVLTAMEQSL
jgi:ferredoxin